MILDDYNLEQNLGKGAFGEVFLTTKKGTDKLWINNEYKSILNLGIKIQNKNNIYKIFKIIEDVDN